MKEWLDDFYNDPALRDTMMRSFLPVFSSYVAEATGGPVAASFVQALAESYVDRHLGSSRAQLQEVVTGSANPLADLSARFDEWEAKRPEKVAANELVRSANAASVQHMKERGVTKKVWASSGGACPFCASLDGVIVEVDSFFLNEGDELNPEGAESPIHFESSLGHPPIHQGCNCSVEAASEVEQVSDGLTPEARQSLDDFRERGPIAGQPERGAVIDPRTGEVLLEKGGLSNEQIAALNRGRTEGEVYGGMVEFTPEEQRLLRGNILTHTHPDNLSFSAEDVTTTIRSGGVGVRAEAPDYTFSLRPGDAGWLDPNEQRGIALDRIARRVEEEQERVMADLFATQPEKYGIGGTGDLVVDTMNQAWANVAKEFGWQYSALPR